MTPGLTPSQTVGPYLSIGLEHEPGRVADPDGIAIAGQVLDGEGSPIPDALVEVLQADGAAFARSPTDDDGAWSVRVPAPKPNGDQAPHCVVLVFARGLLLHLVTRVYLPDHAEQNATDPVLALVPADRRDTLLAERADDGYRFDIRIQGPGETVFFDV